MSLRHRQKPLATRECEENQWAIWLRSSKSRWHSSLPLDLDQANGRLPRRTTCMHTADTDRLLGSYVVDLRVTTTTSTDFRSGAGPGDGPTGHRHTCRVPLSSAGSDDDGRPIEFDVFISHAYEDKEKFVRTLAEALIARNLRRWYDEFTLRPGDSPRRSIDHGLLTSQAGVVVLSPAFFGERWTNYELDGLDADCGVKLDRRSHPTLGPDSAENDGPTSIVEEVGDHLRPKVLAEHPKRSRRSRRAPS
jgi:hypothetical protein